jgi:phage terminase small subunit
VRTALAKRTRLSARQQRFVAEYLVDLNATQAAIRAGYSAATANQQGPRLLVNVGVALAIAEAQAERAVRTALTQDWVLNGLEENYERAMSAKPVLDHEGNPVGEWTYQGSVANRSLELVGKHLGMFTDGPSLNDIRQRVTQTLAAIRTRCPPDLAEQLIGDLRPIWH